MRRWTEERLMMRFVKCTRGKVWHKRESFPGLPDGITRCGFVIFSLVDKFSGRIPQNGKLCKRCERKG